MSGHCEHASVRLLILQVKVEREVALPHLLLVHQVELLVHGDSEDVLPQPDPSCNTDRGRRAEFTGGHLPNHRELGRGTWKVPDLSPDPSEPVPWGPRRPCEPQAS